MSAMQLQFDREKFKVVVHYICANCDPARLGAVKLNKVLYFADMLHFALQGVPITGALYRKRQHGPTTDSLLFALRELAQNGEIRIDAVDYFGYRKTQYTSLREPDSSRLAGEELALLNDIIDLVCHNNTAKTISELSHNDAWERAEWGAVIPYHTAFGLLPMEVSEEAQEWATQEAARIEAAGSDIGSVGGRSFGDFRNRLHEARGRTPQR